MIEIEDMDNLFKLISRHVKKDIACYAFGGNAMMHYGYKNATKDIDIIFEDEESRDEFIRAIRLLGYEKKSLLKIYVPELLQEKNKPLMFSRGEERFDIFLKQVFQTRLSEKMKERVYGVLDYAATDNTIRVFILGKHDIILMKSITQRERDFEDILTIVNVDEIDWGIIVDEAIWQAEHGDKWIILDLEETLKQLKKHTFIKKADLDRLYNSI